MKKTKIDQLYDLVYSPIVTPHTLVDNAKLDHYYYVNFSCSGNNMLVEMKCEIEPGDPETATTFLYYFNDNEKLLKTTMIKNGIEEVVFDRNLEIKKLEDKIIQERISSSNVI